MSPLDVFDESLTNSRVKSFLAATLQKLIGVLNAQSGSFFLFNHKTNELVLSVYYNSKGFDLTHVRKNVDDGVAGAVIRARESILVKDIDADPRFDRNGFAHYRSKSFISIPVFSGEHLIGLLNITDKNSTEPFTEQDLQYAEKELRSSLERLIDQRELISKARQSEEKVPHGCAGRFLNMSGKNPKMKKIYSLVETVAKTRATVLISGESGTGKRLIAHAIHNCDPIERKRPFVEVSCGALTETLLDSELFGHVKGAFTGAFKDRVGRFEMADKGTIFLDEIDAFTLPMQVKLLRVLQDGEFERVGDSKTIKTDIRVIAATNQNLPNLIAQGKFRKDLYYRLNVINIDVPPLRERASDIPLLARDLVDKCARQLGKGVRGVSEEALERFCLYDWPGNVRELENIIERATILTQGKTVTMQDLPDHLQHMDPFAPAEKAQDPDSGSDGMLSSVLKDSEKEHILQVLDAVGWNRTAAAQSLGIDRTTLYKKMVKYGILRVKKGSKDKEESLALSA